MQRKHVRTRCNI